MPFPVGLALLLLLLILILFLLFLLLFLLHPPAQSSLLLAELLILLRSPSIKSPKSVLLPTCIWRKDPFVPRLLGCGFVCIFSFIFRHWGWRWWGWRDAAACEAQQLPEPSWCTTVCPSRLSPRLHGTESKGHLSGVQHGGRKVTVWRLVPAVQCYSWLSWKMAGKGP